MARSLKASRKWPGRAGGSVDGGEPVEKLIAQGRWEAARALLSERLAHAPRHWESHHQLGLVHRSQGEHAEAARRFAAAAMILVEDAWAREEDAQAAGDLRDAEPDAADLREAEPAAGDVRHTDPGEGGDLDSVATHCLDRVESTSGGSFHVLRPSCFSRVREGLSSDLRYATVMNALALCLLELGDIATARRMFCEAVEFIPPGAEYDEPWLWLSRIEDL